jgi:hypothetical protein
MPSPQEAVETYVRAKDENRPYLMERAFAQDVALEMIVESGTISFPPISSGFESVCDVLVRRFGQMYENVHTFCLASPPKEHQHIFSCGWLVGMSEKESRAVRVGCGRYDWLFQPDAPYLVSKLTITIEQMQSLSPMRLAPVMRWLNQLPYPWCSPQDVTGSMPALEELQPIGRRIVRESA